MYDQLAMMAVSRNRKWKHVVLSIESKLSVLDSVAKGVSYIKLSEKFDSLESQQSLV